eukprot:sb/3474203/
MIAPLCDVERETERERQRERDREIEDVKPNITMYRFALLSIVVVFLVASSAAENLSYRRPRQWKIGQRRKNRIRPELREPRNRIQKYTIYHHAFDLIDSMEDREVLCNMSLGEEPVLQEGEEWSEKLLQTFKLAKFLACQ